MGWWETATEIEGRLSWDPRPGAARDSRTLLGQTESPWAELLWDLMGYQVEDAPCRATRASSVFR